MNKRRIIAILVIVIIVGGILAPVLITKPSQAQTVQYYVVDLGYQFTFSWAGVPGGWINKDLFFTIPTTTCGTGTLAGWFADYTGNVSSGLVDVIYSNHGRLAEYPAGVTGLTTDDTVGGGAVTYMASLYPVGTHFGNAYWLGMRGSPPIHSLWLYYETLATFTFTATNFRAVCYGEYTPPTETPTPVSSPIPCTEPIAAYPNDLIPTVGDATVDGTALDFSVNYTNVNLQTGDHASTFGFTSNVVAGETMTVTLTQYNALDEPIDTYVYEGGSSDAETLRDFTAKDGVKRISASFTGCEHCSVSKLDYNLEGSNLCSNPNDPNGGLARWIMDGDMEFQPASPYWRDTKTGRDYDFPGERGFMNGRLSSSNWMQSWSNGNAACDNGYHAVGFIEPLLWFGDKPAPPVDQGFKWEGGMLYWKVMARGTFHLLNAVEGVHQSTASVAILDDSGPIPVTTATLLSQKLTSEWNTYTGHLTLPAGHYRLILDRGPFGLSYAQDTVYYDNVFLSNTLIGDGCNVPKPATPTPTPTVTSTGGGSGGTTNTPGPSPTIPARLVGLSNCSFEAGKSSWNFNNASRIGLSGGPTGSQYAMALGPKPAIYQSFSFSEAGPTQIDLALFVKQSYAYAVINNTTGMVYLSEGGTTAYWTQKKHAMLLPPGQYRIELNPANQSTEGDYDGVSVGYGGFISSYCYNTPTPGNTSYVTPTPSPTGPTKSPTPTLTPWGYQGTATLWPTWTPDLSTHIPGPGATATSGGTAMSGTQTAVATSFGLTQTAWATEGRPVASTPDPLSMWGTIVPPDQQPPPGSDAACRRPVNPLLIGNWLDYEVCVVLSWSSWGAGNTATSIGIFNQFSSLEPFGTISELQTAYDSIRHTFASKGTYEGWGGDLGTDSNPVDRSDVANLFGWTSGPYNGGRIVLGFGNNGTTYSTVCNFRLTNILGSGLRPGVCFVFNILHEMSLLPWLQSIINVSSIAAFMLYITRKWIDKSL